MIHLWRKIHGWPADPRWVLKLSLLIAGVAVILYPKPWLMVTLAQRSRALDSLIQPELQEVGELAAKVQRRVDTAAARLQQEKPTSRPQLRPAEFALLLVEAEVYQRIKYSHDWDTWGVMEYLPTAEEALRSGREDCDGRAIVAASVLRRMGYEAWLVADMVHMWVETPTGQTMSPGSGGALLVAGVPGSPKTELASRLLVLGGMARGFVYGASVFPLGRALLILALVAVLTLHPWASGWRQWAGVLTMLIGLMCLRASGAKAIVEGSGQDIAIVSGAVLGILLGWLTMAIWAKKYRRLA